jgi:hypothetical protein
MYSVIFYLLNYTIKMFSFTKYYIVLKFCCNVSPPHSLSRRYFSSSPLIFSFAGGWMVRALHQTATHASPAFCHMRFWSGARTRTQPHTSRSRLRYSYPNGSAPASWYFCQLTGKNKSIPPLRGRASILPATRLHSPFSSSGKGLLS